MKQRNLIILILLIILPSENEIFIPLNLINPSIHIVNAHDYKVFLCGETHGVSVNTVLKLNFLKSFHEKLQLTKFIVELPLSYTIPLNEFLETGDTVLLRETLYDPEGSSVSTRENYEFYISLYRWNSTLAQNDKIEVLGIDIEQKPRMGCKNLRLLLDKSDCPPNHPIIIEIRELMDKAISENSPDTYNFLAERLDLQLKSNRVFFLKNLNKREFEYFERSVINLFEMQNASREEQLYSNFIYWLSSRGSEQKFFAQPGAIHTIKDRSSISDLTFRLLKSKVHGSKFNICSIMYLYENCSKIGFHGRYSMGLVDPETFEKLHKSSLHQISISRQLKKLKGYSKLSKRFDYILLIKDQEAMHKL